MTHLLYSSWANNKISMILIWILDLHRYLHAYTQKKKSQNH